MQSSTTNHSMGRNAAKTTRRSCVGRCSKRACIFCNILKNSSNPDSRVLYQDDQVWALPDIHPAAVQHVLVLPKAHIPNVSSLTSADAPLVRHMLAVGQQLLQQKLAGPAAQQLHQHDAFSAALQASQSSSGPQQQSPQFKFGFHLPPFRSVDHLHLHCFQLPHKWYRWVQYQSSINWITADQLLDQLARQPSSPQEVASLQGGAGPHLQQHNSLQRSAGRALVQDKEGHV